MNRNERICRWPQITELIKSYFFSSYAITAPQVTTLVFLRAPLQSEIGVATSEVNTSIVPFQIKLSHIISVYHVCWYLLIRYQWSSVKLNTPLQFSASHVHGHRITGLSGENGRHFLSKKFKDFYHAFHNQDYIDTSNIIWARRKHRYSIKSRYLQYKYLIDVNNLLNDMHVEHYHVSITTKRGVIHWRSGSDVYNRKSVTWVQVPS